MRNSLGHVNTELLIFYRISCYSRTVDTIGSLARRKLDGENALA